MKRKTPCEDRSNSRSRRRPAERRSAKSTSIGNSSRASTRVSAEMQLANARPWQLNDPYLYRMTGRVTAAGSKSVSETSTRFGFRDFRFENGYFRLNGRRVFWRSAHTGADDPGNDSAAARSRSLAARLVGPEGDGLQRRPVHLDHGAALSVGHVR